MYIMNNLKFRLENKFDYYPTIAKWYEEHNFPVISFDITPESLFVVSNETKDLYCVPIHITDSTLAYIAFPVSNKNATKEEKEGAFTRLLAYAEETLGILGYTTFVTTSDTPVLMKMFAEAGYEESEKNVTYYIKNLK